MGTRTFHEQARQAESYGRCMSELRVRREPPPFRKLVVRGTEPVSAHMTRVILGGDGLEGFSIDRPAASVRLLLPSADGLEIPTWRGNDFRLGNGASPTIRTFTPRLFDEQARELHLDVVHHEWGAASDWVQATQPGDGVAVSGPGRGYHIDPDATAFLLAGDETAIPAICQLLEHLGNVPISVHICVRHPDTEVDLHRDVDIAWHVTSDPAESESSLSEAIRATDLEAGTHIWAAGEAAAMQHIRKYLFREIDFPRSNATVRGYWKRSAG